MSESRVGNGPAVWNSSERKFGGSELLFGNPGPSPQWLIWCLFVNNTRRAGSAWSAAIAPAPRSDPRSTPEGLHPGAAEREAGGRAGWPAFPSPGLTGRLVWASGGRQLRATRALELQPTVIDMLTEHLPSS